MLNVIPAGDALGPWMTAHPGIDKVSFTGSTATGRRVMQSASATLKRVTLELGGNDPAVVLPDADVEKIAKALFWAAFRNNGQIRIATKRMYVHKDVYEPLKAALAAYAKTVKIGDGADQGTQIGPINNKAQYERVLDLIQDARDNGYRDRSLDTRLGTLNLKIPKLRTGACFPDFLEPRKTAEKALVSVIQEAWIAGVSTRRVDELVQAMGMNGISSRACRGCARTSTSG